MSDRSDDESDRARAPQKLRIRASIATARFGSVGPRQSTPSTEPGRARRTSRLRRIFRTIGGGGTVDDVPAQLAPAEPSGRRRAVARAMRVPSNRVELEPASSVKKTETDLRAVPTMVLPAVRPRRTGLVAAAVVLALLIVLVASAVRALGVVP